MEFYASWCGHCQHLAPVYREAAAIMHEADVPHKVAFAKDVRLDDGDEYNHNVLRAGSLEMFNYTSFPTILVFKHKKIKAANPEHWKRKYKGRPWQYYGGGREHPDDFVFYLSAISQSLDPFDEERKIKPGFYKKGGKHESDLVVDLEPDGEAGFNATILEDPTNTVWIVEFYSDRCPYCNTLAPEVIRASSEIKAAARGAPNGGIRIGAVNSRVYDEIADQNGVTSWPWVAAFYRGAKIQDMAGLGGWESVHRFANEMFDKYWKQDPPKNKFLDSPWASKNKPAQAAQAAPPQQAADFKTLLQEAQEFNIHDAKSAKKLRMKVELGDISEQAAIEQLQKALLPVHTLKAQLAALQESTKSKLKQDL
jgi:thioredoxin-like negative regulator of GroEL